MCIKSFCLCHKLYGTTDGADAFGLYVLEGYLAAEAVEVDTTICYGVAIGGQGVVRAAAGVREPRKTLPALTTFCESSM